MLRGQRPAVWFRVVVNLRAARKEAECISHAVPAQHPRDNMAGQGHERGGAGAHRQQVDVSNAEGQEGCGGSATFVECQTAGCQKTSCIASCAPVPEAEDDHCCASRMSSSVT